jgi:hypothetical protein
MATRGISERSAPGARVTLSGDRVTTRIPTGGDDGEDDEDDRVRRGRELDREAGQQGADSKPAGQPDAAKDRVQSLPVRRGELDERRGERSRRCAGGNALHDATGDPHPISGATSNMTFDVS